MLGLFPEWDCTIGERRLDPGDVLALYTDGITEAFDAADQEFGEERLVASLRRHRELPSSALVASIVEDVQAIRPPRAERRRHADRREVPRGLRPKRTPSSQAGPGCGWAAGATHSAIASRVQ